MAGARPEHSKRRRMNPFLAACEPPSSLIESHGAMEKADRMQRREKMMGDGTNCIDRR